MSRQTFLEAHKITQIITPTAGAAGQTAINSTAVDMKDYDEVALMVNMGTIDATAVTSIKAQQSADNSSFSDLEGTSQTIAATDDGDSFIIDLIKPTDRYVRVVVSRGTADATVQDAFAIQTRSKVVAVTQGTTINSETHVTPDEGTA